MSGTFLAPLSTMPAKKTKRVESVEKPHSFRSILEALKRDHDDLRELIETLKGDRAKPAEKKKAYLQFSSLLKSHAKCEEKAVYEISLKARELKMETYEAYEEHAVAETLMAKISKTKNQDQWLGRVKVLAESVEHHIIEEENEFLPKLQDELAKGKEAKSVDEFIRLRELPRFVLKGDKTGIQASL
jgi:hypothetical protein